MNVVLKNTSPYIQEFPAVTGGSATVTLASFPRAPTKMRVSHNSNPQIYLTSYTVSGQDIVFSEALESGDIVEVWYVPII
jgi:hypothetical protein